MNILNKRKGAHFLIDMALCLKDKKNIELIICGKDAEKIGERINALNYGNIRYVGYVDENEKLRWMGCSNLFLLLSDREGAPASIMDALASGLPVVSTWYPLRQILDLDYIMNNAVKTVERELISILNGIMFYYNLWKYDKVNYTRLQSVIMAKAQTDFSGQMKLNEIEDMFFEIIKNVPIKLK